jgi:carbon-monoxide dehydrogenase medium subunit
MKPAPFEYHRPSTVPETLDLLDRHAETAELMAGNQSLGIVLANRLATPDHVIDINGVEELASIEVDGDRDGDGNRDGDGDRIDVEVGALARHREIERSGALAAELPILPEAAEQIAGPSVRNRGTFGGSLGEADPAGNYPCVLTALEGTVDLESVEGRRSVPASDFFVGFMYTDRAENELITGGTIDAAPFPPARSGMAFRELKRADQTWPTISAAAAVRVEDPSVPFAQVETARLALANAADAPLRVPAAESAVDGSAISDGVLREAVAAVRDAVDPSDEVHADAEFKQEVAGEYARRALQTAYHRAVDLDLAQN